MSTRTCARAAGGSLRSARALARGALGLESLALLVAVIGLSGCATALVRREPTLRISQRVERGDSARRASQRFVLDGLDADARLAPHKALPRYELALQVDPTNPYAYLALSRHFAEQGRGARALDFLDQAEALLASQGELGPSLDAHLVGLRGWSESELDGGVGALGRTRLRKAAGLAPEIWGDGRLSADELR